MDGALGANNPVDEIEQEAADIWCSGTGELKPLVTCFISIGTGSSGKEPIEDNMLKFLSRTLVHIATETENAERKFASRWTKQSDNRYFRFNVEQGLQNVGLAEYKEQGRIEAVTSEYLKHRHQKLRVQDCVQKLGQKRSGTPVNLAAILAQEKTGNAEERDSPQGEDSSQYKMNGNGCYACGELDHWVK